MNHFLFLTHLTPSAKRSAFRQELIDLYFKALSNQSYANWKVLVFGEEEKTEGNFYYFRLEDLAREEKFEAIKNLLQREELAALFAESDYVIKLDDDDLISPLLLESLKDFKGDLYYDQFHSFIDSSSGIITQQERAWVASTCVHKKEHALAAWTKEGASPVGNLLYTDHSKAWHLFYQDKNKTAAPRATPVYLRVLSPTSITSGALHGPPKTLADVDMEKYYSYLRSFGDWKAVSLPEFEAYQKQLAKAWKNFSGKEQAALPRISLLGKIRKRIGL